MIDDDRRERHPVTGSHGAARRRWRVLLTAAMLSVGLSVGVPQAAAATGCRSSDDISGDGKPDVAVGLPQLPDVVYSVGSYLKVYRSEDDTRDTIHSTVPGFGSSLTYLSSYQDSNSELCSLIAVGSPNETVDGVEEAGAVYIYGMTGSGTLEEFGRFAPGIAGVPGTPQPGAHFGAAVASTPRDADEGERGSERLYIGAPGAVVGGVGGAGSVTSFRIRGGDGNQTAADARTISYATAGVAGAPSPKAGFGTSISVDQGIVAIGAPGQTSSGVADAGTVLVLSDQGRFDPHSLSQARTGFPGTAESGDRFGWSVHVTPPADAAGPRLLIGAPDEGIDGLRHAGTVAVVPLSRSTGRPNGTIINWDQDSYGMTGQVEEGDRLGWAVTSAVLGDRLELIVGAPEEEIKSAYATGVVQTIGTGKGWNQATAGMPGWVENGDLTGAALAGSSAGLVIGAPHENAGHGAVIVGVPGLGPTPRLRQADHSSRQYAYGTAVAY
ncbi:hypothetical protein [Microlunatus soli]|uniref:FG-GAP repeat-containing protein n=1 Tax=Microlunatus soli TaxID=630515 RepID=A0A1H1Z529_9ACTN|nr:hypothetical protein [Microlunatus soli]SDT28905.1 hypothetical protein SAMN04489812_4995 [Microlunatus soli]